MVFNTSSNNSYILNLKLQNVNTYDMTLTEKKKIPYKVNLLPPFMVSLFSLETDYFTS